jgi:hypothetical protein
VIEARMDEQERDYLGQQIRRLEQSNRRWKIAALTLAVAFVIFLIVGGVSNLLFGLANVQHQREALMQVEQARAAEAAARLQAEQAAFQAVDKERTPKDKGEDISTPEEKGTKKPN